MFASICVYHTSFPIFGNLLNIISVAVGWGLLLLEHFSLSTKALFSLKWLKVNVKPVMNTFPCFIWLLDFTLNMLTLLKWKQWQNTPCPLLVIYKYYNHHCWPDWWTKATFVKILFISCTSGYTISDLQYSLLLPVSMFNCLLVVAVLWISSGRVTSEQHCIWQPRAATSPAVKYWLRREGCKSITEMGPWKGE